MKAKPLINQLNFPKNSKQQIFVIRAKQTPIKLKICTNAPNSIVNVRNSESPGKEVDYCLVELESSWKQQRPMNKDVVLQIQRLLVLFKAKYYSQEEGTSDRQQHKQMELSLRRKNSEQNIFKQRFQQASEERNSPLMRQGYSTIDLKRGMAGKIISNKENRDNSNDRQMREQNVKLREKIENYENQIQNQTHLVQELQKQIIQEDSQKELLKGIIQRLEIQKKKVERDLNDVISEAQQNNLNLQDQLRLIKEQLASRQQEIILLWRAIRQQNP